MSAEAGPVPVPQRLSIVLPTTGEFDSRTFRIASGLAARGHTVTVLARTGPGLPAEERHPAGYRILRVAVSPIDGLPLPAPLRGLVRAVAARRDPAPGDGAGAPASAASEGPLGGLAAVPLRLLRAIGRVAGRALAVRAQVRATRAIAPAADLVHGMAYMGIPVALAIARGTGARVVYDARDIYVDAANLARLPGPFRALLGRVERGWARRADRVMTVNRPYAEVMAERFGVPLPAIVVNCAYRFESGDPPPRRFHERLGLPATTRVVLYQGGLAAHRGIEQLIEAIPDVPDAVLVLLGYGPMQGALEGLAADTASPAAGRLHVVPGVPPAELLDWVASADVVAMPIQPSTLNHRLTTPNKLFEAMAAGVPVVASDLPGMAAIVRETGCGLLVDPTDPVAIAATLRAVLDASPEERRGWRERSLAAARGTYGWEHQLGILLEEYGRLTGRPW